MTVYCCGDYMKKLVEVGILFDFYGKLLTKKQYQAIDLYYINDYSLAEIGEIMFITRQAVFDTLKRAEQKLYDYEKKLGLVNKFNESQDNIKKILTISKELEGFGIENNEPKVIDKAKSIEVIIGEILD